MNLTATIRTRPEHGAETVNGLAMQVITAEAPDYDAAYTKLTGRIPSGWQVLSVRSH